MTQYVSQFRHNTRPSLGIVALSSFLMALLLGMSSPALADTQDVVDSPPESKLHRTSTGDAPLPAYVILGHKKRLQEVRIRDNAWTLGADGFVISWVLRNHIWRPTSVQKIPSAKGFSCEREEVLVVTQDGGRWRRFSTSGVWERVDGAPPKSPMVEMVDGPPDEMQCDAGDLRVPSTSSDPHDGPQSAMISAPTLRDMLIADHGQYFVFRDGWYAHNAQALAAPEDVRVLRTFGETEQRVWVDGDVIASGVEAGDARIALCVEDSDGSTVIDRNLRSGARTVVMESERGCPSRADYLAGTLRLSYVDYVVKWPLDTQETTESHVSIALETALSVELRASASVSRRCAYQTWDVFLYSEIVGDAPLRRELCARSATALHWNAFDGRSGGSAILFVGRYGSVLLMVDAKTLTIHTLQTDIPIATHAQIRRTADGTWLIADAKANEALILNDAGVLVERRDLVLIDNRLWNHAQGGVLQSEDGHQLLVTDAGVVLNGVGIGPVVWRTLTADMRRIRQNPPLFSEQVNVLRADEIRAN